MSRVRSFVALLSVLLFAPAFAQEEPPVPLRVLRQYADITVAADGSSVTVVEVALNPQTPAAVRNAGRIQIPYQEGRSDVEILEAYSLKPDGTRNDVQPDRILTQVPPAAAQAPAFADGKVKVLVFPDVAVGDQVVYKARSTRHEPNFPGQFSGVWVFARTTVTEDARVTLRAPPKMVLHVDARELAEEPSTTVDGLKVREWRFRNPVATAPEPGALDALDREPRLVVSSFGNWAEVAKAYDSRAAAKTVITDEIRRKASEIVGDRKAPRDKARAIYEWVSANVRYVAVYLGAGGYVPHTADEVLRNRYGDCKDYVAVLGALLAAEGIDSTPVLLALGPRFSLPSLASPDWFNHAMLWVPQIGVYMDATGRVLPFGTLAEATMDKDVLPTRNFNALLHTPMIAADANAMRSEARLAMDDDGKAKGEARVTGSGPFAAGLRNLLQNAPPAFDTQFAGPQLARAGLTGKGTVSREVGAGLDDDPRFTVSFETGSWLSLPGPGAFRLPTGLFVPANIRSFSLGLLSTPPWKTERTCSPARLEEKLVVELPANLMPRVPADVTFSNRLVRYQSRYALDGRMLTATRTFALEVAHLKCSPEEGALLREAAEALRRDVEAQVLY